MAEACTPAERLTKLCVLASAAAALAGDAWAASLVVPSMLWTVPSTLGAAWLCARRWPTATSICIFFACYMTPAVFILAHGGFFLAGWSIWFAALLGLIGSMPGLARWHLPRVWRLALAYWALIVTATWPIVMFREGDFQWRLVDPTLIAWMTTTVLIVVAGILWFDALWADAGHEDWSSTIERRAVLPFAAGWLVAAAVGVYQMTGHIAFLNPGFWRVIGRITGTLNEGNVFGVLSALWGPVIFALAFDRGGRWPRVAGVAALLLSWAVVWGSGSRSSLLIVALSLAGLVFHLWRRHGIRETPRWLLIAVPAGAIVAGAIVSRATVIGPIARFVRDTQPAWSVTWARTFAASLWTRGGFGEVSEVIVRRFPFVGVGVGAFQYAYPSFATMIFGGLPTATDNAQNWYRHELVELGIVGSLGWIAWTLTFAWTVIRGLVSRIDSLAAPTVAIALLAFGLISLVGVPGQETAVVLTMWTLAAWYVACRSDRSSGPAPQGAMPSVVWTVVLIVVALHAAATAYTGKTMLTPPRRAVLTNTDYYLGLYPPETTPDGVTFRWAKQNATSAIPTPHPWLKLIVWVNHADVAERPVDVKVWSEDRPVVQFRLATNQPQTIFIRVPSGQLRTIVKTWVSRSVRPKDFGGRDPRELGLQIAWQSIVDAPPSGAVVVN